MPAIPITATSLCNGLGRTTAEVWSNLDQGTRGLRACPLDVPFDVPCGVVDGPLPEVPERFASSDSRTVRLGLLGLQEIEAPVREAIARYGANRVGLVVGTSTGGIEVSERAYFGHLDGTPPPPDYTYEDVHPFHRTSRVLAEFLGLRGPVYVCSTACSSSAKAFCSARRLLRSGRCDAVLVGGVDGLAITTIRGFHSLGVYDPNPCRPFAADRQGINVGEGAGFALLDPGGEGLAYLLGAGESNDAFHMSAPHPEGLGAQLAMRRALEDAGLDPNDIEYINAHGTGTVRNDTAEASAIEAVFAPFTPVVSTKSYTGHLLGAGGVTEAIFAIGATLRGVVPANLDVEPPDPDARVLLPTAPMEYEPAYALSNSFAFGGNNVSLIFGAAPA